MSERLEPVALADLRSGDLIELSVFSTQEGWVRERRTVVSNEGGSLRVREGEREYDWPVDDRSADKRDVKLVVQEVEEAVVTPRGDESSTQSVGTSTNKLSEPHVRPPDTDALIKEVREALRRFEKGEAAPYAYGPFAQRVISLADALAREREAREQDAQVERDDLAAVVIDFARDRGADVDDGAGFDDAFYAIVGMVERAEAQMEALRRALEHVACLREAWSDAETGDEFDVLTNFWKAVEIADEALASLSPPQENQEGPTYDPNADPDHGVDGSGDAALL